MSKDPYICTSYPSWNQRHGSQGKQDGHMAKICVWKILKLKTIDIEVFLQPLLYCGAFLKLFLLALEFFLLLYCCWREEQCTRRHGKSSIVQIVCSLLTFFFYHLYVCDNYITWIPVVDSCCILTNLTMYICGCFWDGHK